MMTTINVTVENTSQAKMLVKWLNEIKFVKKTSLQKEDFNKGNIKNVKKILSNIDPQQLFSEITNPVEFQNQLRNEW
jgi:hypothetical protein